MDLRTVFIVQKFDKIRTYAVGRFLAGAAREKSSEIQTIHRKCVSPKNEADFIMLAKKQRYALSDLAKTYFANGFLQGYGE